MYVVATSTGLGATTEPRGAWTALGDELVRLVREHFYDTDAAASWADRHRDYARSVGNVEQFETRSRLALAELRASHTAYYTSRDPEYYGLLSIFGATLSGAPSAIYDSPGAAFAQGRFVLRIYAGGPAAHAGLRRGDEVLLADGRPFHPVESFRGKAGRPVRLSIRRRAGAEPEGLVLVPRRIDPKEEWLQDLRQGTRVVDCDGRRVAYVPLFCGAGQEFQEALADLIATKLRDADSLVLDLRDGFGGCSPSFVSLFDRRPAVLTYRGRDAREVVVDRQWRRPLVLLINKGSRSGKEVLAHSVKQHSLGPLTGKRTAGAVLGGRPFLLSDKSLLYLAVQDVRVDGVRLEGSGVAPDVEVDDVLSHADGADPQLEKALKEAAKLVNKPGPDNSR